MDTDQWVYLMNLARKLAKTRNERVRVYGFLRHRSGERGWAYVIDCASDCACRRYR